MNPSSKPEEPEEPPIAQINAPGNPSVREDAAHIRQEAELETWDEDEEEAARELMNDFPASGPGVGTASSTLVGSSLPKQTSFTDGASLQSTALTARSRTQPGTSPY